VTYTRQQDATTRLHAVLFNYEDGGRLGPGRYNFDPLCIAFADVAEPPVVIGTNEAKEWDLWEWEFGLEAADRLSRELGHPYEIRILPGEDGRLPSAVLYDPTVLALRGWGHESDTVYPHRQALVRFRVADTGAYFQVFTDQWAPYDGALRLVPDTYRVHVPRGAHRADYPSGHQLEEMTLWLSA
jgi:hypothetical protein